MSLSIALAILLLLILLPFYAYLLGKMQALGWIQALKSLLGKGHDDDGAKQG